MIPAPIPISARDHLAILLEARRQTVQNGPWYPHGPAAFERDVTSLLFGRYIEAYQKHQAALVRAERIRCGVAAGELTRKTVEAIVIKTTDSRRQIEFIASAEVIDSYNDLVRVRGIDTSRYLKNPVLLANHNTDTDIGKVTSLRIETRQGVEALIARAELRPAGQSAVVDEIWSGIQFGSRRGFSIGFIPVEWQPRGSRGESGIEFLRSTLYEISSVTVPACDVCLITEKACAGPA